MANTVTIGKTYFEALLRRAELHASSDQFDTPAYHVPLSVTISKEEHDSLLQAAREYYILRNALFRGGLDAETLNTLIAGESGNNDVSQAQPNGITEAAPPVTLRESSSRNGTSYGVQNVRDRTIMGGEYQWRSGHRERRDYSSGMTTGPSDSVDNEDREVEHHSNGNRRTQIPRSEQRTLLFSNLGERTTHKDIVALIRGGRLLEVYVRNDKTATVSFVEGAQEFLQYAKKNDFYVHSKRLEVRWNDRQFHVPGHVASKIGIGATRNIVIYGGASKLNEQMIREDLDHIHNLVVIEVEFKDGNVYISTNSIHNSLFARTCMMSRTTYKGLKIEWYPDECAAPIPKSPSFTRREPVPVTKSRRISSSFTNRFGLLNIDGTDEGSSDDEDDLMSSHGVGLGRWADTSIVA